MIIAKSTDKGFITEFTDGQHTALADPPADKGGDGAGFSPFALIEAALAGCLVITMRMYAKNHDIELDNAEVSVTVEPGSDGANYVCVAKLPEGLSPEQKKRLQAAMKGCPIHGLLTKPATFDMKVE